MRNRPLKLLILAFLNAAVFHFAYVDFLHAVFAYADFRYEPTSEPFLVWTYIVAMLPVLASRPSNEASAVGCALIYALSYVPIQLTLTFMWSEKGIELMLLQTLMAVSMTIMFLIGTARPPGFRSPVDDEVFFAPSPLTTAIHVLSIVGVLGLLIEFHSIIKFVSFEDVYDLRSDSAEIKSTTVTNYLIMWLTYCFGPFYIGRALLRGHRLDWAAGMAIFLLVYGATGSKLALLTPLFMLVMRFLDNGRDEFLMRFLSVVIVFIGVIVAFIPEEGILRWVNSIFLLRVFGSNGWTAAVYYEYFTANGYTFYNHIGPVKAIFAGYPYGESSLGQQIARAYFSSNAANFNAGFWASDGFAALGTAGVAVVTVVIAYFLKVLNDITRHFPLRLINLWLMGFWMALMNVPLSTALLSCGGLLVIVLLWLIRPTDGQELACA